MSKYSVNEKPLKVGITGGIGSGKTLVCEIFKHLNIAVYHADTRARYLMENSVELVEKIKMAFGAESYSGNKLNRPYLAQIVFSDRDRLKDLNDMVHPEVEQDFNHWTSKQKNQEYVLHEAAILFESGTNSNMDKTIFGDSPKQLRINRVMLRDNIRKSDVIKRMNNQWPAAKLRALTDFIVINNNK